MSAAAETRHSRRTPPRRRFYQRWWFWLIVAICVVAIAAVAWVGARAQQAKTQLESAQSLIGQLKTQAVALDVAGANQTLQTITKHTHRAIELTSDPVWRTAEIVPVLGRNFTAVRQLAAATEQVMTDVAAPLISVAAKVDPASFAPKDGAIDIQPLEAAIPAVARANKGLKRAVTAVKSIDTEGTIGQVVAAKKKVSTLLASVAPLVGSLNSILPLLPPALGADAPRTYVVMFQNNAEARPLGGTALSFAVVKVDKGKIELGETIPAGDSNFPIYGFSLVPEPDGVQKLYAGGFGTFIANATVRPSFTSAAEITVANWTRQFGYTPDGILSIDPIALSYVLRATDPITLPSGDVLSSTSLVPLLLNTVYQRYNSGNSGRDNRAQDKIYGEAVSATFGALTGGKLDAKKLVAALTQGWNEHRVLYWSSHEDEQKELLHIGLNGELPVSDNTTDRVGVYFLDNVGSKMNFYLKQAVHLAHAVCRPDGRQSYRVTVDLTNTIQPSQVRSLSPSIVGQWQREKLKPGVQRMIVLLYAPPGSQITGATMGGAPINLEPNHDTDYPVGKLIVTLPPGANKSVSYDVVAAKPGKKKLEALVTPMVNATPVTTSPLDCSTVAAG